jgi:hypothetical protein
VLRFIISLSIGTILLILGLWGGTFVDWWLLPSYWKETIFFLFFITLILTNYLFKLRQKQPHAFVQFYLLSITLKIIAGLGFVFLLIWKAPSAVRANVGLFITSYLIFTALEVNFLMRKANPEKDT